MTYRMLDAVDVAALPDGADAYAGYVGGRWPTWSQIKAKFGHAHLVSIAISASEHALCLDIETGDATPAQAAAWVKTEHSRNVRRPILYASASVMPSVLAELRKAGIARADVRLWSAHYAAKHICGPTTCNLMPVAADGTQWTDAAAGVGGVHIDESLLDASFFTQPAPKPPAPAPAPELFGYLVTEGGVGNVHALTGRAVTSADGGKTWQ